MSSNTPNNDAYLPSGESLPNWRAPQSPSCEPLLGDYCTLRPLVQDHASSLYDAYTTEHSEHHWAYLPYGPYSSLSEFERFIELQAASTDPAFYSVFVDDKPLGVASYLRIKPADGSIEVGHIHFSSLLQNTRAATEAMFLMMEAVFSLGYRRYEWKCNALNEPSMQAARRLGFTFEGIFRQATVVKGCNRDTAWFSVIDGEWPALKRGYQRWLAATNFDDHGQQIARLSDCIAG